MMLNAHMYGTYRAPYKGEHAYVSVGRDLFSKLKIKTGLWKNETGLWKNETGLWKNETEL